MATSKRTRIELVDSQAVPHSQPATEGGRNGIWPMPLISQPQALRSMPWPELRSAPARNTTGALTMPGESSRR